MTASMSLRSSTLRKSRVVKSAVWLNCLAMLAAVLVTCRSSTSQSATSCAPGLQHVAQVGVAHAAAADEPDADATVGAGDAVLRLRRRAWTRRRTTAPRVAAAPAADWARKRRREGVRVMERSVGVERSRSLARSRCRRARAADAGAESREPGTAYSGSVMKGEAGMRLLVFAGVLGGLALAEHAVAATRPCAAARRSAGRTTCRSSASGTLPVRAVAPAGVVTRGAAGRDARLGSCCGTWTCLPAWRWAVSVLALDLAVYAQHVAMHKVPWLWRLHRVHHADVDVDVTTGVRFHPIEFLLSLGAEGRRPTCDRRAGRCGRAVRSAAERDVDVQPRQPAPAGARSTAWCACSW